MRFSRPMSPSPARRSSPWAAPFQAKQVIDATGKYVLPGAIDSHVHFRAPGYDYKEDWQTGTGAAARGGVTTVLEMPNTNPPTGTLGALKLKQDIAARQAYVDYGIYGLLDENNIDELEALIDAGRLGVQVLHGQHLRRPAGAFRWRHARRLRDPRAAAACAARCTPRTLRSWRGARRSSRPPGRSDPLAHLAARPEVCAIEAVSRAVVFAEWTGARLHIAHKSSKDALYVLRDAKARGVDVTVETCPQYLLLSHEGP